jgi:hypothetical protein
MASLSKHTERSAEKFPGRKPIDDEADLRGSRVPETRPVKTGRYNAVHVIGLG